MSTVFDIGGRRVGDGWPPYVIAEAGVNHNGDPALAVALVHAAADSGADAVKFQTFNPADVAVADARTANYQRERVGRASQRAMLEKLQLPEAALRQLQHEARSRGIALLSTPFDLGSLAALVDIGIPAIKIGSGDATNLILLRAVARTRKPVVLSTGMTSLDELRRIVPELSGVPLVMLHCTSAYPAPADEVNLRAIQTLRTEFGLPIGYSDHTSGSTVAVAAVALGAVIIEKHLTLDRTMPGPDHVASLEPGEFQQFVRAVHGAHLALGDGIKRPMPSEGDVSVAARKSVVAKRLIPAGSRIAMEDLTAKRPATGIPALDLDAVVGASARRDIAEDAILTWDDVEVDEDRRG